MTLIIGLALFVIGYAKIGLCKCWCIYFVIKWFFLGYYAIPSLLLVSTYAGSINLTHLLFHLLFLITLVFFHNFQFLYLGTLRILFFQFLVKFYFSFCSFSFFLFQSLSDSVNNNSIRFLSALKSTKFYFLY